VFALSGRGVGRVGLARKAAVDPDPPGSRRALEGWVSDSDPGLVGLDDVAGEDLASDFLGDRLQDERDVSDPV